MSSDSFEGVRKHEDIARPLSKVVKPISNRSVGAYSAAPDHRVRLHEHGVAKLSKGVDSFASILQAMGVPDPHFMARLTILTELLGGLAVILGAFVAMVSLPMAAVLLVAMFTVHLPYGFSSIKLIGVTASGAQFGPPGYEVDLLYIACLAALVLGGSGPFALDGLIGDAISSRLRHSKVVVLREEPSSERSLSEVQTG